MPKPSRADAFDQRALDIAVFLLLALSLTLPSGYSAGAMLLLLLGLWRASRTLLGTQHAAFSPEIRAWALAIAAMGLAWSMHIVVDGQLITHSLGLDRCVKYLLVLLVLPVFWGQRPCANALRLGCWTGATGAGALALWQVLGAGDDRAAGHTNAIQFGNLALLLSLWSAVWALQATRRPAQLIGWASALLGLTACVASGSRGGWLALPLLMALVLWLARPAHAAAASARRALAALAVASAATLALTALPPVQERVELAMQEYQSQSHGFDNTSIGLRLSFWRLAWAQGLAHPLLGAGQQGYENAQRQAVARQAMPNQAVAFNHAHNEWLDMFAKRGLTGVAALLLFYGVPAALLWRQLRDSERSSGAGDDAPERTRRRAAALCGLVTVVGFSVFGLTQVMFAHNNGNMMYLLTISVWLAASLPRPAAAAHRPSPISA